MLPRPPFSRRETKPQRGKLTFPGHTAKASGIGTPVLLLLYAHLCLDVEGWGWPWDPRPISLSAAPGGLTLCTLPAGVLHPTRARSPCSPLPQWDPALRL